MSKPNKLSESEVLNLKREQIRYLQMQLDMEQGLPHIYGFKWYKWAREFYESENRENFLTAANQASKPICVRTEIPTPRGFKKLADIQVGDFVFGQDGRPTEVIDIPFVGDEESYEIEFNDESKVIAGKDHLWICKGYEERFRKTYTYGRGKNKGEKYPNKDYGVWKVHTTKHILEVGKYAPETSATKRFSIPISKETKTEGKNLFDPYYVGVYLGNGSEHSITLNSSDTDIAKTCLKYGNKYNSVKLVIGVLQETRRVLTDLGICELSYKKQVPEEYMLGSTQERKLLLAGLMDTDGTCNTLKASSSYSTTSPILAKQVLELACSLGGMGFIRQRPSHYLKDGERVTCRDHYIVYIWMPFNPFKSARKAAQWRFSDKYKMERVITKITPVGKKRVKCITVDNADGSFLCTRDYIVTHNSSTMIRKFIHWATEPKLWKGLWPSLQREHVPNQFWYFYPTQEVATIEFETKWAPLFLPRNKYKDHPVYGWKDEWDKGMIRNIRFNSGVTIYFKTYSQKAKDLQTGTVYLIGLDEECPVEMLPELQARLNATDGYMCSVFTATIGQLYWEQAMERKGKQDERHKDASKWTVSLFDCLVYEDGTPSHWDEGKIKRAIARCPNDAEVQRRIYGRFVKSQGLMYESFSLEKNTIEGHPLPSHWHIFTGIDIGSGGMSGHPAAIIFVAVSPDYKRGRVFKGWRGDGIPTTSEDILNKYTELLGKYRPIQQTYDYAAKDFYTIASRKGFSFTKADKDRAVGIGLLNTLFKTEMLKIHSEDHEMQKLISEISSLSVMTDKRKAQDDMIDALRYCVASIPWDFSDVQMSTESEALKEIPKAREKSGPEKRREWFMSGLEEVDEIEAELDFWNRQGGASE